MPVKGPGHGHGVYYLQKVHINDLRNMKRIMNRTSTRLAALLLGGSLAITAVAFTQRPSSANPVPPVKLELDKTPISRDTTQNSYAPVVKKVSSSVVQVYTSATARQTSFQGDGGPPGMDDFLRRFFGDRFEAGPRGRGMPMPRQQGVGSGVIVTKDGYILTNNHVVDGADQVRVALQDGRQFDAKVIGRDPKSEVAVIKIDAKNLPVLTLADSDNVEVGDVVLAVGNPFGIGQTVTTGIVSATGRAGTLGLDYEDFIQTDAAINPGNSGGALVDIEGRLIGINTAILSRSGGNQGIGFAIPTNLAKDVMESLMKDGHVTRGYLGVMIQDLTPDLAEQFNAKSAKGALVGDVSAKGPAEKAGLRSGDVVVAFNGKKIDNSRHLKLQVARTQPGTTVPVKVLREGSEKTLQVKVQELPGENVALNNRGDSRDEGSLNGVAVADIDTRAREQFRIPEDIDGVVVTDVAPDSEAAQAGVRPGDVVLEINRKPVNSAEQAVELTKNADEKRTLLRLWRDGGSRFVVVDETKQG